MSLDNRNVSTQGIEDGVNYLEREFISKLDDEVSEIINTYSNLQSQGILSSQNIDSLTTGIKGKITELQTNFSALADRLKHGMIESSEQIQASRTEIENQMTEGL